MNPNRISLTETIRTGGLRLRSVWKMLVVLYLANLGCALLAGLPLLISLEQSLSTTPAADRVLAGFDYDWFSRFQETDKSGSGKLELSMVTPGVFLRNYELLLNGGFLNLPPLLLGIIALYGLIQVFFSGGVIALLARPAGGFRLIEFLGECGAYFFRFLKILILGFAVLAAGSGLFGPLFRWAGDPLQESGTESLAVVGGWMLTLATGILLGGWAMAGDYARIRMVQDRRSSSFFSWLAAMHLIGRRPSLTALMYLLYALAGILLAAGFSLLGRAVVVDSAAMVLAAWGLQQLFMITRIGMRLALLASQTALYQSYQSQQQPMFR